MYDFIIIGGGILGMSTAMQLQRTYPDSRMLLLEKEAAPARHQTGHNSGVIHAGVYYTPGSLKAKFCLAGNRATKAFCDQHGIAYEVPGKLLVATNDLEMQRMQALWERTAANGIEREWLNAEQLREREPNIQGLGGIFVPSSGIVNYAEVTAAMAREFINAGGEIRYGASVTALQERQQEVRVQTSAGDFACRFLLTCAGLMADRVVRMLGIDAGFSICPFRGEYFRLPASHNQIVNHLIYPIPDPSMPFLGVHLTRMIDGSVTVGPNAVLAFKRGYLQQVRKYCPSIQLSDLQPHPAGVRAQAVSDAGQLIDDFLFRHSRRSLHVCNAPSPAATSALPIGAHIVAQLGQQLRELPVFTKTKVAVAEA